jgi:hypothetical protein
VIHNESPPEHWDNGVRALHTVNVYIGHNLANFSYFLATTALFYQSVMLLEAGSVPAWRVELKRVFEM